MFTLNYSVEKNRIYIKLHGVLSSTEFETYKNNIISLIDNSKVGFTVLADLSQCDSAILEQSDNFNIIREYGAKRGVKANALVLNEEVNEIYNKASQGKIRNAFLTIEAAERYLDVQ
jgi:hypothetical protein